MDRIAPFIVSHARAVLALTALISLAAALMLFRMDFNADVASFMVEGNETGEAFKHLQEKYATADPINVVATLDGEASFRDKAGLTALVELRDQLSGVEGVAEVASIVPATNPATGEPLTAAAIAAAPDAAIGMLLGANPVASLLLDADGENTLLLVIPADDALGVARELGNLVPPAGVELTLSGNPVVFATVLDVFSLFLLFVPPLVIVLLIAVFYATIGDLRLSVLAIVPAALGSLWTFGLIFALGREVDIVTIIVPIFVIVMGSADGLHFVTHFQDRSETSDDAQHRVGSALSQVGVPMILTTISTAAGFLSLLVTDVQPIRQLGLFAAIGIVFAGIISFFSLPALMSRLRVRPKHHRALLGPRVTRGLKALVRTRLPAIALTLAILAFAAIWIPRLAVDSDQLFFFKDDDPVREAFERTEDLFGGATPLSGEFAFDGEATSLADIARLSAEFEALPGVREVFSVADVADAIPPEQLAAILEERQTLPLGDMVSEDGLRFVLFPSEFTTEDLEGWLDFVDENDQVRVLTGMPIVWDQVARLVLQAQAGSVIVAFILVAILLLVAYRRIWETAVALVPISLTILAVLAFVAASGIQLNLLTAVVSSIVIGVGVDYSIHYIAAINRARRDGDGYVLRAIDTAGRPIVANALGIAIALSALWLSPLKIHGQVSMIMWVAMITASLTALVVIPAFLPRKAVHAPQADQPHLADM